MLNVTVRQLRVFAAVARHSSFARAAEALHLTPPAVSMQVRALEDAIGLPLFDRRGRGVRLTLTGEYLLAHARQVLAQLKEAEDLVARLRRAEAGPLAIGMLGTAKYFLPRLLAGFLAAHPGVELRLTEGNRERLVALLKANELDLAVMGRPPSELGTRAEAFAVHPLGVVAAPGHPLAGPGDAPLAVLATEPFIVREHGSGTRLAMEALFREHNLRPPVVMELDNNETIKQAVMAGLGVAFMSLHAAPDELRDGRLVALRLEGLPLARHWHVVHARARTLSPVAEAFRYHLLEHGEAELGRILALDDVLAPYPGAAEVPA